MILRRFMLHIKEQNWFAVGLDVLVVIVGIFLGMQVTEWNAERKNQELAESYLHRIISDMEMSITRQQQDILQARLSGEKVKAAASMVLNNHIGPSNFEQFKDNFSHVFNNLSLSQNMVTVNQILDNEKLDIFQSSNIKDSIIRFRIRYELLDNASKNAAVRMRQDAIMELYDLVLFDIDDRQILTNINELNVNIPLYNRLHIIYRTFLNQQALFERMNAAAIELKDFANEELKKFPTK